MPALPPFPTINSTPAFSSALAMVAMVSMKNFAMSMAGMMAVLFAFEVAAQKRCNRGDDHCPHSASLNQILMVTVWSSLT
jgi:hypothetical protein